MAKLKFVKTLISECETNAERVILVSEITN